MRLQDRTLAALIRWMGCVLSNIEIDTLFLEFSVEEFDSGSNRQKRSMNFIKGIQQSKSPEEADRIVIDVIERIVNPSATSPLSEALLFNLKLDGFEFVEDKLRPTTPAPAALSPEISALENELIQHDMEIAKTHYVQAVDNFTRGNWEGCNSQIRPFVENLFIGIGECLIGTTRSEPVASLQDLKNSNFLDDAEFNQFKSFWSGIQDKGPHQGFSNEQEALFRLHVSTSIARYLIFKLSLMER